MTGHLYRVSLSVTADTPATAAQGFIEALGFDENSINDVGGVQVTLVPDDQPCLVCRGCGEAFADITAAQEHGTFFAGPDPQWCGEAGFDLMLESEAF